MTQSLFNKVSVFYGLPENKRGTGSVSQLTHIVTVLSNLYQGSVCFTQIDSLHEGVR